MRRWALVYLVAVIILGTSACLDIPTATPAPTVTPSASLQSPTRTARPTPTPNAEPEPQTATVSRAVVNVRDEPGGAVIGSVEAGDVVTVLSCRGDYCEIEPQAEWDVEHAFVFRGCLDGYEGGRGCEAR
ncbi:MAG TPA: SH3 domain-containing protein [Anaerolineales bacterium]|nr:SH3 domain-containing protein [Anaerolineales bacterium]